MAWPVILLLFLSQELPDDLPPLLKAQALLSSIENKKLSGDAAFQIAKQAYALATQTDPTLDAKDFPRAFRLLGSPEWTAARAWAAYEKHRDRATTARLPFPNRLKSSVARCDHELVDDPEGYLGVAIEAGSDEFAAAMLTLRSPVEIGSALAMLPQWRDPRAVSIGMELVRRLRRAVSSRREYDAAKDLEAQVRRFAAFAPEEFHEEIDAAMQYYEARNQGLPACGPTAKDAEPESDNAFSELKRKVLRMDESAASEFEYLETLIQLFQLAGQDSSRLDELESAGNARMRVIIRQLRQVATRRASLLDYDTLIPRQIQASVRFTF